MSTLIELELKGLPPTVNSMYRNARGIRYKTKATQEYQAYATSKLREKWHNNSAYGGLVELSIKYTACDNRRWDIDNRLKALQDCLSCAGIIKDDSQIEKLTVERTYGKTASTLLCVKEYLPNGELDL